MKKILILILLLLVFAIAILFVYLKNTAPIYSGEIQTTEISDSTKVIYDDYGVPHIYANNGEDAYFALGYAHAQERLFQMEMLRRMSRGKLSEILGPKLIPIDKKMITLGFNEIASRNAKNTFDNNNGEMQQFARAYQKGINSFIDIGTLPIEFTMLGFKPEHFIEEDIYTALGFMALGFTTGITSEPIMQYIRENFDNEHTKLFEADDNRGTIENPKESIKNIIAQNIVQDFKSFPYDLSLPYWEGSNAWLVSPKLSQSGKSIFANDTHIGYSQPSVWFEAYMEYPGFELYGYYIAGMPFAIIGHSQKIAWGITIFPVDNMNLYYETINPKNSNQYLQNNEWLNFETISHTIKVKDSSDVKFDINLSKRGPIISNIFPQTNQENDKPVSLWWTPHHITTKSLEATYQMSKAQNMVEFEKAMPNIDMLGLNIMYADKDNIAWWAAGLVPKYAKGFNTKVYNDGSKDTLPHEFYDFSRNPRLINPEKGYIITANNSPGIYDSLFIPGYYFHGYRAQRIEQLLLDKSEWNIEDMKAIQNDVFSSRDLRISKIIIENLKGDIKNNEAVTTLKNWDGNYNIESVGAIIYSKVIYNILEQTFKQKLGEQRFGELLRTFTHKANLERLIMDENSVWWDNNRSLIFNTAMAKSIETLHEQYGSDQDDWQWGKIHTLTHVHAIGRKKPFNKIFNVGPYPKSGSNEVVDKESFIYSNDAKIRVKSGPALRCLIDFAEPTKGIGIIPTGQSGNIMSLHYQDQAQMFVDGEYRPHIMNRSELQEENRTLLFVK